MARHRKKKRSATDPKMIRRTNQEHTVDAPNRFTRASELHFRYKQIRSEVERTKFAAWENFVSAYDRLSYMKADGSTEPNFGDFHFRIEEAKKSFSKLAIEREHWIRIIPMDAPDPETEKVWSEAISHNFHKYCIKQWKKRAHQTIMDIFGMLMFTHGIELWESEFQLYPDSVPPERLFPNTLAGMDSDEWDLCFFEKTYTAVELFLEIEDKELARKNGWDVDGVMRILRDVCDSFKGQNYRDALKCYREGGMSNSEMDSPITVIFAFVREYEADSDGNRVSVYKFPDQEHIQTKGRDETGEPDEETLDAAGFLCVEKKIYKTIASGISLRNHKTHRSYWNCPSLAQMIYVASKFNDKALNKAIRGALRSLMVFLSTNDPDSQHRLANLGDNEVHALNPQDKIEQYRISTDISQVMELIREVGIMTDAGTASKALPGSQNVKGGPISASEANLLAISSNEDTAVDVRLFVERDCSLVSEIYRRWVEEKFDDGTTAKPSKERKNKDRFDKALRALEIPEEATLIENVDIVPVFSLDSGTRQQRVGNAQNKLAAIRQYSASTTDGERRAAREWLAALDSWENVDYYLSRSGTFEVSERVLAGVENGIMSDQNLNPANVQVNSEQSHPIHIGIHLGDMEASLNKIEQLMAQAPTLGQVEAMLRIDEAIDLALAQDNKGAHTTAHIRLLQQAGEEQMAEDFIAQLTELQKREGQIEQQLDKIREEVFGALETGSLEDEQVRHLKEKNQETERHLATMNSLKLAGALQKTEANMEGAADRNNQSLRHAEERAAIDLAAIKAKQQAQNEKNKDTSGTSE